MLKCLGNHGNQRYTSEELKSKLMHVMKFRTILSCSEKWGEQEMLQVLEGIKLHCKQHMNIDKTLRAVMEETVSHVLFRHYCIVHDGKM